MVFCYIICPNSKTILVVSPRFWVVQALERLPTCKFDLQDLEEVAKVNLPRLAASRRPGQPKIEARPPKRSRCICIQYNRRFCCIFGQRFMPSQHQSLSSSDGRASGSHAAAPGSIPGFGIAF